MEIRKMAKPPDDRPSSTLREGDIPDPKLYFVLDGKQFVRPSLETYYADTDPRTTNKGAHGTQCSCNTVEGTYCSCNKVCSCNLVCSCESVCSCEGYSPCSCVGYQSCSCDNYYGGSSCSCNKVCTCVPVH